MLVHLDKMDSMAPLDLKEILELQEHPDLKEILELQEQLDNLDHRD